ncbi:MAG: hypothetical protein Q8K65_01855 [Alphaproteobacteria bacterium]|nr:hypothetical protein [Alphaproteobacteria bacterium]
MSAKVYQEEIYTLLQGVFPPALVKKEWNIRKDARDVFQAEDSYAPCADIAIGPFNEDEGRNIGEIIEAANAHPLVQHLARRLDPDGMFNQNPRCLLAIEIEYSGSMKHILGDIANASMLGYIGIVIGSNTARKPSQVRIQRVKSYIEKVTMVGKAPGGLFGNVVYFEAEEFRGLLLGMPA